MTNNKTIENKVREIKQEAHERIDTEGSKIVLYGGAIGCSLGYLISHKIGAEGFMRQAVICGSGLGGMASFALAYYVSLSSYVRQRIREARGQRVTGIEETLSCR
ncbi:MAG: hypothetical protein ABIJ21_01790 [Nanoarchaeota archaeon]